MVGATVVCGPWLDVCVKCIALDAEPVIPVVTGTRIAAEFVAGETVPEGDPAVCVAFTGVPVAVGVLPVYAKTGSINSGSGESGGSTAAFWPSGCTGLLPGSLERVPRAVIKIVSDSSNG